MDTIKRGDVVECVDAGGAPLLLRGLRYTVVDTPLGLVCVEVGGRVESFSRRCFRLVDDRPRYVRTKTSGWWLRKVRHSDERGVSFQWYPDREGPESVFSRREAHLAARLHGGTVVVAKGKP